jgi:WXG100 family type VII secretion target
MEVDPAALTASAARAGDWSHDLLGADTRCQAAIEAARDGWAGASAAALGDAAGRWAAVIQVICTRLDAHAATLRLAAAVFAAADETGAGLVSQVRR